MAITINPIVPDEDEEPRPKKRSEGSTKSDRSSSGSSARSDREPASSRSRPKEEEPKSNAEKEEIADKMKMRYGLDEFKYTELPSKASTGKRNHRTGGRKTG